MEWCDDDLLPIPSSRNGFDWDMESTREGVTVSPLHRPNSSRDLMAFACQRYPPCSPQFKVNINAIRSKINQAPDEPSVYLDYLNCPFNKVGGSKYSVSGSELLFVALRGD